MVQAPPTQADVAFARTHTLLHAPQLLASADVWTSHPSTPLPLQLEKPEGHGAQTLGDPAHA